MISILLIEDDEVQRSALVEFLESRKKPAAYTVYGAENVEMGMAVLADRKVHLVISDLMLPDGTGIDVVKSMRDNGVSIPVLILTGQPSIETAIESIRAGASDYLLKPVDLSHLETKVAQLIEHQKLRDENRQLRARLKETFTANRIIGHSSELKEVIDRVEQIAFADVTVNIDGESGTGKELIANLIHENSPRAGAPFIRVNCGAIAKSILESELFGVVKGAFTGADRDREGLFEAAHGGTIFLDEIGELDLESQVRLLRVLEEKEVVRLGSTTPRKVDVRVISATNRDLLRDVEDQKFREDLYYRLAVIRLHLPPLRNRIEDLPLLFNHFVVEFNDKYGKSVREMSDDLLNFFKNYHWPGNIRQFKNVIEAMVVLSRDDVLEKRDLPPELTQASSHTGQDRLYESIIPGISLHDYEKAIIKKNLNFQNGNREKSARTLGISERTMYRKLKEYEVE